MKGSKLLLRSYQRSELIYVLLGIISLISCLFPITLALGIPFYASSLLFFVVFRMYGWRRMALQTVLVHAAAAYLSSESFILIILFVLEAAVVTCLSKRWKRNGLLLPDFLFWMLAGIPLILIAYYLRHGALELEVKLFAVTLLVNSLLNALLADMLAAYVPFGKDKKPAEQGEGTIRLSQLLVHITLFSIIGSSFLFMVNTGKSSERAQMNKMAMQGEAAAASLHNEYEAWSSDQIRMLGLKSMLQVAHMKDQVSNAAAAVADQAALYDAKGQILMTYDREGKYAEFEWMDQRHWIRISPSMMMWKNPNSWLNTPGTQWSGIALIYAVELKPYTLYLKLSTVQYQEEVILHYMSQSVNVLYIVLVIGIFTLFLQRFVLQLIIQLAQMTTDLPVKIKEGKPILWLHSNIVEIQTLIHNFQIVTERLQVMLKDTKDQAHYDILTGMSNRRHFNEYLGALVEQRIEPPCGAAVMFIDLDRFKQINDMLGHGTGDGLLLQVAKRMKEVVGPEAFIARLGGDEFAIIVTAPKEAALRDLAERVLEALARPFRVDDHELFIGGSIGIARTPEDGVTMEEVMRNADAAMYLAKQEGGSAYRLYSAEEAGTVTENMSLEYDLRKALESNALFLHYQPVMDTRESAIAAMEALVRWNHPLLGPIPPGKFIPIAESSGLIGSLGEWVIREACEQSKRWREQGLGTVRICVNLSPTQLSHCQVAHYIERVLEETMLPPDGLEFEITEEVFMRKPDKVIADLQRLQDLGVRVWIDDFGKGYSSLGMLRLLPVSGFKIDRTFVSGMASDPMNQAIVRTILSLAEARGLEVIGEGVEEAGEMEALHRLGCFYQQGYYHARPGSAEQMTELLKQRRKHEGGIIS